MPKDVVIVTGGARGVTAASALALAQEIKPTLILIGRSPLPAAEPLWLAQIADEAGMKKAILAHDFSGKAPRPQDLEKTYQKYAANREILHNLETFRACGATVAYFSSDVRDGAAISSLLDKVRAEHGPVRALIHGAGALEDRLIIDKTPQQFERVFDTKVRGFQNLLKATASDDLRYIVIFSSVAARFGNIGQADYAMANEVLNKMARKEAFIRPKCRVISLNWGPWDGGMVSSALKKEFARRGIELIDPRAGAMSMVAEMRGGPESPVEVILGSGIFPQEAKENTPPAPSQEGKNTPLAPSQEGNKKMGFPALKWDIDLHRLPVLNGHKPREKPHVPFALIMEWLGYGALHENPGLFLHGLDDLRLLEKIYVSEQSLEICLFSGKAKRRENVYESPVELKSSATDRVFATATAVLTDTPSFQTPAFAEAPDTGIKSYSGSIRDLYDHILCYGPLRRGIKEILNCTPQGMVAALSASPLPEKWMKGPLRNRWIGDPLALDSAFQMAALWCHEEKGLPAFPGRAEQFRQYRSSFPSEGVTAVLEVRQTRSHSMKGDVTFMDSAGKIVACLKGYEAEMNTPGTGKATNR
jgi:NAD(P)-dependent dehydrogenase (short-subunit alcohol dehydrogenase family)